jgi:hypothetical protein
VIEIFTILISGIAIGLSIATIWNYLDTVKLLRGGRPKR